MHPNSTSEFHQQWAAILQRVESSPDYQEATSSAAQCASLAAAEVASSCNP